MHRRNELSAPVGPLDMLTGIFMAHDPRTGDLGTVQLTLYSDGHGYAEIIVNTPGEHATEHLCFRTGEAWRPTHHLMGLLRERLDGPQIGADA